MSNILLAPGTVSVRFALDPVYNNLASLYILNFADVHSEVDVWVKETAASLTPEQTRNQLLVLELLYSAFEPDEEWSSFPAYLDDLTQRDPYGMRDRFLNHMFPGVGEMYARGNEWMDLEMFIARIDRSEFDREFEPNLFAEAYTLLGDPPAMRDAIVSHLTTMWHQVLAPEWEHNKEFLEQVVDAFRGRDYSGLSAYEAIRSVTGREAHGNWQEMLASAETLVFIPSPHIGPYLLHYAYVPVVRLIFGARLPHRAEQVPVELTRPDLLVQLRALADDTRLRILELLFEEGELCAQEIVNRLGLAKSSGSRHLSQLSATGYLIERQGAGKTKCYTLNPERFRETLRFLGRYAKV